MVFYQLGPAEQIILIMKRIYEHGMTTTSGGNLSVMDENGSIWITPTGVDKGSLTKHDIVCVQPDGTIIGRHLPSVEYPFHKLIYESRKDVKAVLHAHPPSLVSFSMVRRLPLTAITPDMYQLCGKLGIAEYGLPGSEDLSRKILHVLNQGMNTVLLENHGTVVVGEGLIKAFLVFEAFDFCARIEMNGRRIGSPISLDPHSLNAYYDKSRLSLKSNETVSSQESSIRDEIILFIQRAYRQKLMMSAAGTYSHRLDNNSFIITPPGVDRQEIESDHLLRIDLADNKYTNLDRITLLHQKIYEKHQNIKSIITAHPPHMMAYAVTQAHFDSRTIPESFMVLRDVRKVPFGTSPERISELLSLQNPLLIVENDCITATGTSLLKAFDRLEVGEYTAKALIDSKSLGEVVLIDDQEIKAIEGAFPL